MSYDSTNRINAFFAAQLGAAKLQLFRQQCTFQEVGDPIRQAFNSLPRDRFCKRSEAFEGGKALHNGFPSLQLLFDFGRDQSGFPRLPHRLGSRPIRFCLRQSV